MATNPADGTGSNIVSRAKNIIMRPKAEWVVIDAEPATIGGIYRNYVVILAAIPPLAQAIGMYLFGFRILGFVYRPPLERVIGQAVLSYLLSLVSIYLLALIIEALAPTFGGTKNRVQAFKVAAYGATASWLAGIFGIIPNLAILSIVGLYSLYLYYVGLPLLMKVPQDKAVGYIAAVIVSAIVLFIVVGAVTVALLSAFAPMAMPGVGSLSVTG
jgi:hypothetical protein